MRIIECIACVIALVTFGCSAGAPEANEESVSGAASEDEALKLRRICDGPLHLQCPKADYCSSVVMGHCPGPRTIGFCARRPDRCIELFQPVCGCDGQTYSNSCFAAAAGVAVDHAGECAPVGPFCGGIAGIPCPGSGQCVDNPNDGCDPKAGGADCGGSCSCEQTVVCKLGAHFDADPKVCSCVPNTPARGPFCGGIAGIPCPGFGKCVDDPSDNCDPQAGGADCAGLCSCRQTVACRIGAHFDSDPNVCDCVPGAATQ
jgi:hypothetical protein